MAGFSQRMLALGTASSEIREAFAFAQQRIAQVGPQNVEDFSLGPAGAEELAYRKLWRTFYDTIAIEGRYNPKCRMTNMPKRYWAMMTEFQKDWDRALPEVKGQ